MNNTTQTKENEKFILNNKYLLWILLFTLAIIPIILKAYIYQTHLSQYDFNAPEDALDLFYYWKAKLLVIVGIVMFCIVIYYFYRNKWKLPITTAFIPLGLYAVMCILSTIFSKYMYFSIHGFWEMFQNIFVLLSYCMLAYFGFFIIQSENDLQRAVKYWIIGIFLIGLIGLSQFIGHDLVVSDLGKALMVNGKVAQENPGLRDSLGLTFGKGRVYATLYNPNYVGVYVSMALPFLCVLTLCSKNKKKLFIFVPAIILMLVCLVGSWSRSGIFSISIVFLFLLVIFRKNIISHWKGVLIGLIGVLIAFFIVDKINGNLFSNRLIETFRHVSATTEPSLSKIETNDNNVVITYNNNPLSISYEVDETQNFLFDFQDAEANSLEFAINEQQDGYIINDERFSMFTIKPAQMEENIFGFIVVIEGVEWPFSKQVDNTYQYFYGGNFVKIQESPSVNIPLANFFGERAYIWGTSIPVMLKYIFLGSGPDTYTFAYPHYDYVNYYNIGLLGSLISKPHNMYLQIGIETGMLSLIAFIAFFLIYFISSLKLYLKGSLDSLASQIGAGILISTTSYMVAGLANDSSVSVAPIFWTLIGVGIAANQLVKKERLKVAR